MNIRRKNRLWIACAVLAGLALTIGLVLYALRSNIDLFYTPGEILYGKRETQQMPEVGQRLRVGGMVMPGSVQRDPNSLKVTFTITMLKAQWMSLTKAFCRICSVKGRALWCRANWKKAIISSRKKCWRNTMKTIRRQKLRKRWKLTTVARRVFIRTQHHDARNW